MSKTIAPKCHACGQCLPQPRAERMTAQLAFALQHIASLGGDKDFVHVAAYGHSGTHARLKHWDLIEAPSKKRTGWWRLTSTGKDWLAGRVRVPEEIQVLRDRRVSPWSGNMISFEGALDLVRAQAEWEAEAELEWLRDRAREERSYLEED